MVEMEVTHDDGLDVLDVVSRLLDRYIELLIL